MKMKIQTAIAYGQSKEVGLYALANVVNALMTEGVEHPALQVRILIPAYAYKSRMHTMEKFMKRCCMEQEIELLDIASERSNVITQSMVVVTGSGFANAACEEAKMQDMAGKDIVLIKWIGMEGMLRVLGDKEAELKERFSTGFLKKISSYQKDVFSGKEIVKAKELGADLIRQISDGGVFAALWNLSKETGSGLEVDLKKIPILQETVEVCEFFRLNPYQLTSTGAMLLVVEDGESFAQQMNEQGVPAVLIGKLTDNNDKVLKNGEEIRYIDRPAPDEIMKIFEVKTE